MTEIKRLTLRIRELTALLKKDPLPEAKRAMDRELRALAMERKRLRGY